MGLRAMRSLAEQPEGARLTLPELRCVRRSHYERELKKGDRPRKGESLVVWRYEFRTVSGGERVIYSGKWLHGVEPETVCYIKATVKKQDREYSAVRIARPELLKKDALPFGF